MRLRLGELLDRYRLLLARPDALVQLALLGLVSGLLAGGVIVLFRVAVESSQAGLLPGGQPENYEMLPVWLRILLPTLGGLLIGGIFLLHAKGVRLLGVAGVMERMAYHQGYITLRSFVLQFVGAAIAIVSGHSVGREGPHVFLGAASGSLMGQYLTLPNNSIRTMIGCGTAAGIAASFNTPLAGVIFALEVVMMEYTLASFMPVMLAAASANAISVAVLGSEPAFRVPDLYLNSLKEMPLILLLGVVAGTFSAIFIHLLQGVTERVREWPFWWRSGSAGLLVGLLGALVPEVMGIGYDTVNTILLGQIGLGFLAVMLLFKLLATVACVGMGIPGGMIGPALFLGATLGGLLGQLATMLLPHQGIDVSLYALLGMGAVLGASLQAPLAALTSMVELTYSPQIIMPGIVAIVVAGLTASELFRKESLFIAVLKAAGMRYDVSPVTQALRRIGVAGVMDKGFVRVASPVALTHVRKLLEQEPRWLLIHEKSEPIVLMPAVELVRHIQDEEGDQDRQLDLMEIPARRYQASPVDLRANLQEALQILEGGLAEALYVERMSALGVRTIHGVLTRESVESAYHY